MFKHRILEEQRGPEEHMSERKKLAGMKFSSSFPLSPWNGCTWPRVFEFSLDSREEKSRKRFEPPVL
jgi:hypothetical protein